MKPTNDEKTLALVLMVNAPDGSDVPMDCLKLFFDRPGRLERVARSLLRWEWVNAPAGMNTLRINREKVLKDLRLKQPVELFSLPVAGNGHESCGNSCAPAHAAKENFAPVPKPKPPPVPPKPPDTSGFHAPHAIHAMLMPSGMSHVLSCNSVSLKKIHEGHEVGELSRRTTDEMISDIKKLCPKMLADHVEQWRKRIGFEDAFLVNSIIREAQLQWRYISNMGGWMNACYLKAIKKKEADETAI